VHTLRRFCITLPAGACLRTTHCYTCDVLHACAATRFTHRTARARRPLPLLPRAACTHHTRYVALPISPPGVLILLPRTTGLFAAVLPANRYLWVVPYLCARCCWVGPRWNDCITCCLAGPVRDAAYVTFCHHYLPPRAHATLTPGAALFTHLHPAAPPAPRCAFIFLHLPALPCMIACHLPGTARMMFTRTHAPHVLPPPTPAHLLFYLYAWSSRARCSLLPAHLRLHAMPAFTCTPACTSISAPALTPQA